MTREALARFVATYWRDAVMASDTLRQTGMSHPLAMVLAALDGETDPAQLGISEDRWDDFRARAAAPSTPPTPLRAWLIEQSQQAADNVRGTDMDWHRGYRHAIDATLTWIGEHPPTPDTLGDAWAEVERRLPDGWMLGHAGFYANQTWGEGWSVHALSDGGREVVATAPTFEAALRALAAALPAEAR